MKEFIHHKIQVIEEFFEEFNQIQRLYSDKSFDFEQRFGNFLTNLSDYFRNRGESNRESEILRIKNMLQTLKRGFDPVKLEKVNSGKRELWWGFSYHGIECVNASLQEIYNKEALKLEGGKEILSNLILNLCQQGILTNEKLKQLHSVPEIEAFWNFLLTQNGTISSIHKKLLMTLIIEDIYLLIENIVAKITSQ